MNYARILGLASSLLVFSLGAPAQGIETSGSPFYSTQEYQRAHSLFDNLHADLNATQASVPAALVQQARAELNSLENNWDNGVYSSRQMDQTIGDLELVAEHSASLRASANLDDDVSSLLSLRREYY